VHRQVASGRFREALGDLVTIHRLTALGQSGQQDERSGPAVKLALEFADGGFRAHGNLRTATGINKGMIVFGYQ
jgi:hypothetical protein